MPQSDDIIRPQVETVEIAIKHVSKTNILDTQSLKGSIQCIKLLIGAEEVWF